MASYQAVVELELPDVDTNGAVTANTAAIAVAGNGEQTDEAPDLGSDSAPLVVTGYALDQDQADDLGYVA